MQTVGFAYCCGLHLKAKSVSRHAFTHVTTNVAFILFPSIFIVDPPIPISQGWCFLCLVYTCRLWLLQQCRRRHTASVFSMYVITSMCMSWIRNNNAMSDNTVICIICRRVRFSSAITKINSAQGDHISSPYRPKKWQRCVPGQYQHNCKHTHTHTSLKSTSAVCSFM